MSNEVTEVIEHCKACGDELPPRTGRRGRPKVFCDAYCRVWFFNNNDPAPSFWVVDDEALKTAIQTLGITLPCIVYKPGHFRTKSGSYYFRNGYHSLQLYAYLDPERASRVLWHELEHARQKEAGELEDYGAQRRAKRVMSTRNMSEEALERYYTSPAEAKAKKAEDNHDWLPLVRERRPDDPR